MAQHYTPDLWSELQRRIVRLVAQGYNNRDIAGEVLLSELTVERLVTIITHNLGLGDRLELIIYGIVHGMAACPPAAGAKDTARASAQ